MKINKNVLKALIKECIVEVLADGVGNKAVNEALDNKPQQPIKRQSQPTPKQQTVVKEDPIKSVVNEMTQHIKDPTLASLLADTAGSDAYKTLSESSIQEGLAGMRADASGISDTEHTVSDIVKALPGNSKWADIAFANKKES